MSITRIPKSRPKPVARRRRSADEAKSEALASARKLLLEKGPDAVTLKAVAADLGTSHTNLLHHFGSAAELQSALMGAMVHDLALALEKAVAHLRSDSAALRELIDIVFDAFEKGGAGQLAAWIALSGNLDQLTAVREAVNELVKAVEEKFVHEAGDPHQGVTSAVLFLALMAFGDSMIGSPLKDMLERERAASRKIASFLLPKFFL